MSSNEKYPTLEENLGAYELAEPAVAYSTARPAAKPWETPVSEDFPWLKDKQDDFDEDFDDGLDDDPPPEGYADWEDWYMENDPEYREEFERESMKSKADIAAGRVTPNAESFRKFWLKVSRGEI